MTQDQKHVLYGVGAAVLIVVLAKKSEAAKTAELVAGGAAGGVGTHQDTVFDKATGFLTDTVGKVVATMTQTVQGVGTAIFGGQSGDMGSDQGGNEDVVAHSAHQWGFI